jgi:hypothetical protein
MIATHPAMRGDGVLEWRDSDGRACTHRVEPG